MREGSELMFNQLLDGKCQFIVIVYHFRSIEIYRSEKTLRHEMVLDWITNPAFGGTNFIPNFLDMHWDNYLYERKSDGTFDDEVTLRAMSDISNSDIFSIQYLPILHILFTHSVVFFRIRQNSTKEKSSFCVQHATLV